MKHDSGVWSAQFSPDGQRVVTASMDQRARVWDAATGKALGEPMQHTGAVNSAQFSPDGQRVVTASADGTARVWDAATGKALSEPMKHDNQVYSAQFSPDGQRVVTASWDQTARVWDIPTITTKDSADDVNLLANLAEATADIALQAFGQTEILAALTPDQVKATRDKIAARFAAPSSNLTPLQRLLKWSVANPRTRPISPFSDLTVTDWVNNRIKEGTRDDLRDAMFVDPANARLAAHFGRRLADYVFEKETDPDAARRARAEADTQTQRAVEIAPADDEVKTLRADVVKSLQLGSESPVLPAPPGPAALAASAASATQDLTLALPPAAASPSLSPAETPVEMTPVPEGGTDATPRAAVLPAPPASHPPVLDDAAALGQGGRAQQDDPPAAFTPAALGPKARGRHDHKPPQPTFWQRLFGHKEKETKPGKPRQ
jgi:dipeptidyl aminopeptidase/acylaminoacyl peptidase